MGCGGCGSSNILPGYLSRSKNVKGQRVRGYSGSGIIKSQKRLTEVENVVKALQEAAKSLANAAK